jgi:hypothetical protein
MILSVALQTGTTLANVRYEWLANGVVGAVQSSGIAQPDPAYSTFRLDVTPPAGAEELIVYDVTDVGNWNVAGYLLEVALGPTIQVVSPQLTQLRFIAAAFLRVDPSVFIVNGVDLFLTAVNSARRSAELRHDFEYSRVEATVNLVATGVSLKDAVITQGEAIAGLKSVVSLRQFGTDGLFYPLDFTRFDIALERDRSELELRDMWGQRYPSDQRLNYYGTNVGVVQRGQKLYPYPSFTSFDPTNVTLYIDGYGLLRDYGTFDPGTEPEDFIVQFGLEYLQWATICELNTMLTTFVPRQEGNLAPPTAERDSAWHDLILWDSYLVDAALTRSA